MSEKYVFGSPDWIAAAHRAFNHAVVAAGPAAEGVRFTLAEVYTGAPVELASSGTIAWHCRIHGGQANAGFGDDPGADLRVISDYEAILPIGRTVVGSDPAARTAYDGRIGDLVAAGKLRIEGNPAGAPAFVAEAHDLIASVTA